MAVVAGTATFAPVKLQRIPSAPTSRKFWGGKVNHPAGKMGSKFMVVKARYGSFKSGGAGVLERPSFDQSQFDPSTQVLEGQIQLLFSFF